MPVDMKGWKVVYENHAYKCLQVEPIWNGKGCDSHGFERPDILRVSVIDHDARFMVIENYASQFAFLKETNI